MKNSEKLEDDIDAVFVAHGCSPEQKVAHLLALAVIAFAGSCPGPANRCKSVFDMILKRMKRDLAKQLDGQL